LHPVREARFVIPLVRQEIEGRGATYRYRLLSREEPSPPEIVRARLGLDNGVPLLRVRCLHLADNAPYQLEDRWINLDAVPGARTADFETVSPNEWLVENAPFTEAEFTFRAAAAGPEEAAVLQLRAGEPVFVGERITWLRERPITLVSMIHPPSHRMVTRL
ncbi:GntR family transcriptional regulator, partial [Nitratireductor sp. GCM10026969]|uniref:GntR family transcriptional regulator n=1 Tax=Nitratireductor sp. GCM10026969 TaxID=3252645 RepID=UPI00361CBBBE